MDSGTTSSLLILKKLIYINDIFIVLRKNIFKKNYKENFDDKKIDYIKKEKYIFSL